MGQQSNISFKGNVNKRSLRFSEMFLKCFFIFPGVYLPFLGFSDISLDPLDIFYISHIFT